MNFDMHEVMDIRETNKVAPKGTIVQCPICRELFRKREFGQLYCSSNGEGSCSFIFFNLKRAYRKRKMLIELAAKHRAKMMADPTFKPLAFASAIGSGHSPVEDDERAVDQLIERGVPVAKLADFNKADDATQEQMVASMDGDFGVFRTLKWNGEPPVTALWKTLLLKES